MENRFDTESHFLNLGQSSSKISILIGEDKVKRIRKQDENNPTRFYLQYQKHKNLEDSSPLLINFPKVLSNFENNSYEMEYINGTPLGYFLKHANHSEVNFVCGDIQRHLLQIISDTNGYVNNADVIVKLKDLELKLSNSQPESSIFLKLVGALINSFKSNQVPKGWNHGDFSFENIIVESGSRKLFMVDLLNSPFESPLIDLGRLSLDANYGWWASGFNSSSNLQMNSSRLSKFLDDVLHEKEISVFMQNLFIGFAILRIEPYTIEPLRMAYLKYAAVQVERQLN